MRESERKVARERQRKYYAEHKDEINARARDRRRQNPEKARAAWRKWYYANRETRKAYMRKYYEEHRDALIGRAKQWNMEHRDGFNARRRVQGEAEAS